MKTKIFVGCKGIQREVFKSENVPTYESHGHKYNACIGPFRTMRGANFMAKYGLGNPHCQTVTQAERLGKNMNLKILRIIEETKRIVPTENGFFDARKRLEVFGRECLSAGIVPFLGYVSNMTDLEVDRLIDRYLLN